LATYERSAHRWRSTSPRRRESSGAVARWIGMRIAIVVVVASCGEAPADPAPATPPPKPAAPAAKSACPARTAKLPPGLALERWAIRAAPIAGEPCIDVVRVDLARHKLRALSQGKDPARTAPAWRDAFHLAAVTNA